MLIVIPVFVFATFITFLLGAASGLSPAAALSGDEVTPERIAQINAELGLDQPLIVQYLSWMAALLRGDLGVSWYNGFTVTELIGQRLTITASIAGMALIIGIVAGTALGIIAALNQGRAVDRAITATTTGLSTLPPFVVSIGLIVVFSVWLRLLPSSGYVPFGQNPSLWFQLIIMPSIALSLEPASDIARQLRTGLVHSLSQPYITGAVVRGLSPRRILTVHALRNGSGPAIAVLGMKIPALLGGAVVTETIFNMPGFGLLAADSALRGDVPVVQGTLVISIVLVLAFNVLVNVVLTALQPATRRAV
ncbi:ABC transporter permease [Microbacterium suwonense]|uniref:ABC transporter permease n=2 Tax=Microbacterium suwonense TaxID=683047 RepID=A0ABN6WYT5_9MICO|nr:ABC transporter permease [Microbacterium suwonense]BDZ37663.1 ABC transporter permease [Microbacterium suwonense]